MNQTLQLKGNEFYAVQDIFEDLKKLPEGWSLSLGDGVQLEVCSDPAKTQAEVKGEILTIKFTMTIQKDSALLVTDQPCRSIETFVYDIVTILKAGLNKLSPEVKSMSDEEAQDWVKRCIPHTRSNKNLILGMKGLIKPKVYSERGWSTGRYKMEVRLAQDNDPLMKAFAEMYGGDKLVIFYMQENGKPPFHLVVREDTLYYDSGKSEYFDRVLEDLDRIVAKIARGSFRDQGAFTVDKSQGGFTRDTSVDTAAQT